jgi:hypothetical protein
VRLQVSRPLAESVGVTGGLLVAILWAQRFIATRVLPSKRHAAFAKSANVSVDRRGRRARPARSSQPPRQHPASIALLCARYPDGPSPEELAKFADTSRAQLTFEKR